MELLNIFFDIAKNDTPLFVWLIFAFITGFYCGKRFDSLFNAKKAYALECEIFHQETPFTGNTEIVKPTLHFEGKKFVLNTCKYSTQNGKVCRLVNEPCSLFSRINI